ncbi:3,4-dihydroxy 2-butanone 4-phosphate synthase [Arthroderma sp. PD_2]|nr:3,4-dihydroxy 2-butanone 4-phosphate synthase [Arthroderma sp. PD_2]
MASPQEELQFNTVEESIEAFKNGEFIIVLDSEDRENEGDLIIAADSITTSKMAFMVRHSSGYICAPILPNLATHLELPQMVIQSTDPHRTAYTVSIDSNDPSITTGISAHNRALTCRTLASPDVKAASFRRPGHILPLQAKVGGVRERRGHTEATVDLCRLAGKFPAGVICELVEDGESQEGVAEQTGGGMLRRDGCLKFGKKWGINVCTIEAMVEYLERTEGPLPVVNGKH